MPELNNISQEKLLAFVFGDLSCEEEYDIERLLSENPNLADAVNGITSLFIYQALNGNREHSYLLLTALEKRRLAESQYEKVSEKPGPKKNVLFQNRISFVKRAFDLAVSIAFIVLFLPILILVPIIIRLESKGPIIYKSKRVGTGYNIFDLYMFRTMRQGTDIELKKIADFYKKNAGYSQFVPYEKDPRVTKFGHFLRASGIDQLPQFWNIIKGDMSVVGNRPLPLYEAEQLTRDVWAKRFLAPAGLTGLWQVSTIIRSHGSVSERVILDNTYADYQSFWLDLRIFFKTFPWLIAKTHS